MPVSEERRIELFKLQEIWEEPQPLKVKRAKAVTVMPVVLRGKPRTVKAPKPKAVKVKQPKVRGWKAYRFASVLPAYLPRTPRAW